MKNLLLWCNLPLIGMIAKGAPRTDGLPAGEFPAILILLCHDPVGGAGISTNVGQPKRLKGMGHRAIMDVKLNMVAGVFGNLEIVKGRKKFEIPHDAPFESVELGRRGDGRDEGAHTKNGRFREPFADPGHGPPFADDRHEAVRHQGKGCRVEITQKSSKDFDSH
jgi:hypothetical protein